MIISAKTLKTTSAIILITYFSICFLRIYFMTGLRKKALGMENSC